jgi:hypothetical protein
MTGAVAWGAAIFEVGVFLPGDGEGRTVGLLGGDFVFFNCGAGFFGFGFVARFEGPAREVAAGFRWDFLRWAMDELRRVGRQRQDA